ncbi:hypothetical protein [Streptomyces sp. enrichment culture]|uniref:hypothetical protein n=1 Tax=Streptomyces sp. enrichment culture TaxID=1795815 RepID=UPI003F579A19
MKGSAGVENVPVGAISLATDGDSLVVSVEHDGKQYEVVREPWSFKPEDGQIYHSVTANGLAAIFDEERV